jgi:hypothetical protein
MSAETKKILDPKISPRPACACRCSSAIPRPSVEFERPITAERAASCARRLACSWSTSASLPV